MTPEDLRKQAISNMTRFLDDLAASDNLHHQKRSQLLAYWLSDYVRMLRAEDSFDPKKLIRYKRGQIVKAHLGYRIGSEEGGLHYAIVIENQNPLSSPVVTIIPLTSVKKTTNLEKIPESKVFLGNEIYRSLFAKMSALDQTINRDLTELEKRIDELIKEVESDTISDMRRQEIDAEQDQISEKLNLVRVQAKHLKKVKQELQRMKIGSIALVGQITTISKQRIYDPLYPADALHNIRVSDSILELLDKQIIKMFTHSV